MTYTLGIRKHPQRGGQDAGGWVLYIHTTTPQPYPFHSINWELTSDILEGYHLTIKGLRECHTPLKGDLLASGHIPLGLSVRAGRHSLVVILPTAESGQLWLESDGERLRLTGIAPNIELVEYPE